MAEVLEMKEVKCFQHCNKQWNIFCFTVPLTCPLCNQDVTRTPMRIPPFLIDSPFTCAEYNPCSILIKPTTGSFLTDFDNNSNLHIGLTSSKCCVMEFDERGITVGDAGWTQCLCIDILKNHDDSVSENWDQTLKQMVHGREWSKEHYEEERYNCFDFVTQFLQHSAAVVNEFPCVLNRSDLCREMIVPLTHKAGQYISLYRGITQQGHVLQQAK